MSAAGLLVLSPRLRAVVRVTTDLRPWALAVVVIAWSLSLGPMPRSQGRGLDVTGPYLFLFEHVAGFDGLRVPARLAMLVCFGLAVLAERGSSPSSEREARRAGPPRSAWQSSPRRQWRR